MPIRTVVPGDRAEWLRMRSLLWPGGSPSEHAREIDGHLAGSAPTPPLAEVFVAPVSEGRLGGFLELSVRAYAERCSGPVPYVEGWYVDPPCRGRGVGRALMEAAEAWALRHGYREIASDAEIANTASQRAHRRLGFAEVQRLVHYRKELGPPPRA